MEERAMHSLIRGPRAIAMLAIVGLAAGACSPGASTGPGSTGSAATPGATAAASQPATIPQGGTLSVAYASDLQHLDPAVMYDTVGIASVRLMFEAPLTYDNRTTQLVPLLVTDMPTISNDGKTYTLKFKTGINFVKADGSVLREMTADDFVYSLNRVLDPNLKPSPSPVASAFFGNIVGAADVLAGTAKTASGIKATDATTVQIDLVKADATFNNILATTFSSVVPKELAGEDTAAFDSAPVGTGPYLLGAYTKGQQATFVANKHYWQAGQPYLDEIDIKVLVDDNAALQQVQAGTLDILGDQIPSGSFTQVTTDPQYADQIVRNSLVETQYLSMDTSQPSDGPLSKLKVRQAIEAAIDKPNLIKIYHGAAVVADCILPPAMIGFDPTCKPYTFDQTAAKALLADAGYPTGFKTTIYTDTTDPDPKVAAAIQQDLAAIGITVDVVTQTFDTFLNTIETPHVAPLVYVGWFQDYPDPSDFIDPILSCASAVKGGANAAWWCDPAIDTRAAAARGETDATKRVSEYQAIQKDIMAAAPWVPLMHQEWVTLESKRVGGFVIHPVWLYSLRDVYIKPGT
jgi:peptide/nickel transport system substrate-binding protein/oligopeptide transport system substrate-binding protein